MRHVSRTYRVALDWLFDRIDLDPKIQIMYIDTKNQLADILIKGNFTRDEWNHLLCLFNISHFSSTVLRYNGETISTRFRGRTSHSKIASNDESYCKGAVARIFFDFRSREKRSYGSEDPWSSIGKREERSGRPDIGMDRLKVSDDYYHDQFMESFSSASYSKWDDDRALSSQELKTDIETYERSGRPDETSWRMIRKVRPGFSHKETHHNGTAQSVVNKVMYGDRPGRPDLDSQEVA